MKKFTSFIFYNFQRKLTGNTTSAGASPEQIQKKITLAIAVLLTALTTSISFAQVAGDTCENAIDLTTLTSPHSSTTVGAANNFSPVCNEDGTAPDVYYSITVPYWYKLRIGLTASNYHTVHSIFFGTCGEQIPLTCASVDTEPMQWHNTTGSAQTVYWVQDGYDNAAGTYTLDWELIPPPACNIPNDVTGTFISDTNATVSWTIPVTGTPAGYEYAVTTSETHPESGTPTTALAVQGVTVTINQTNYLHVRTFCATDGYSEWVTTSFYAGICIPLSGQGITNVTIGTINNTTEQFSGTSDFTDQVVSIGQSVTYPLSITVATFTPYNMKIWVDWNDNNAFDANEEMYSGITTATATSTITGTLTVPANAPLGNHRMRVGGVSERNGPTVPCYPNFDGAFEDYTINVTPAPTCFMPVNPVMTVTGTGIATIRWAAPAQGTTPVGYQYAVTTSATPPANGTANTTTIATGVALTANAVNYIHVRTNCGGNDYSEWATVHYYYGYCIPAPAYLEGNGITNVTIGTLNNTTEWEEGNYGDFSNLSSSVGQGVTQAFSIGLNVFSPNETKIWIDWNDDLDFNDAGEEVYSALSTGNERAVLNGYFTVPINAALGNHRMRIGAVMQDNAPATPCFTGDNASYEDYTLTVTNPPSCYMPTDLTGTSTAAGIISLSWTTPLYGGTPSGYEYAITTIADAPANGTATTLTAITNVAVTPNFTSYVHVRTNCGNGDFSEWRTISVYNGYCLPATQFADGAGITNFTSGTINNSTQLEDGNYGNYSTQIVNVGQGVTQPFSIGLFTVASYNVKIWADWNDNYTFDAGEEIYSGVSADAITTVLNGTFNVPVNTPLGQHRLRIGAASVFYALPTPCSTEFNGAYEDYTINVTTPPGCFTPTLPAGVTTGPGVANVSWAAPTLGGTPTGYEYAIDTSVAPPESGTAITATSITGYTGLAENTFYYLHVRTNCGTNGFSEWVTSLGFKYLPGDTCESAIDLSTLTSPYTSTTDNATDDFIASCGNGSAPDLFYSIQVPVGYTLTIGQTFSTYNFVNAVYYGSCDNLIEINCTNFSTQNVIWQNLTGAPQTVYWLQDGLRSSLGLFTLEWSLAAPAICDIPRNADVLINSPTTATATWLAPATGAPTGYEYAITTSATPPENGTATTGLTVANITTTTNVTNYLHVRSVCSETSNSEWVTYEFYNGYCIPENTFATDYYITGITTTGGETNFSNTGTGFSGYTDYTADYSVSTYSPGGSFTVTATHPSGEYLYAVWVDWNHDFEFSESERNIFTGELISPATLGNVVVPPGTAVGQYRMRIRNAFQGGPLACGDHAWGEAEDYTVNIIDITGCLAPYALSIVPADDSHANLNWNAPAIGASPTGYEYVFGTSATEPAGNGTTTSTTNVSNVTYNPAQSVYLFVRSVCGEGQYSPWVNTAVLGTNSPELAAANVIVYKEANTINITSGTTIITGVTIYDTRGRILYGQADINTTKTAITGLQLQQQVIIVEVKTAKGKVSKRMVF